LADTSASQIFRVSPIIITIPLSPNKTTTETVTIENLTTNPLPLQTNLNDFETTGEEGGYVFPETRTNPLLSWITLNETTVILGPKEKKKIFLTIKTPQAIPLGGYYGMLFFEPVISTPQQNVTYVIPKVGILLLGSIGVLDPKAKNAEIVSFSTGLLHQTNQFPLLLRVKNISLHYLTAKPILTITPLLSFSQQISQVSTLEDKLVFQGKIRRWEQIIQLENNFPNIYKVHLTLSSGNGNVIKEERYLVVFPFMKTLFIFFILLLLGGIITKRKQLKNALKALFG